MNVMRVRARPTFALLLAVSLLGAFAATATVHAADRTVPSPDSAAAIGGSVLASEAAAVRSQPQSSAERWLERLSKARPFSILAALVVMLGLLGLSRPQGGADLIPSSVRLRRHSVAHRAPPSLQLA